MHWITKVVVGLFLLMVGVVIVEVVTDDSPPEPEIDKDAARASNIYHAESRILKEALEFPKLREEHVADCTLASDGLRDRLEKIKPKAMGLPAEYQLLGEAAFQLQFCIQCVPAADEACETVQAALDRYDGPR